jgi:hypothetical protein
MMIHGSHGCPSPSGAGNPCHPWITPPDLRSRSVAFVRRAINTAARARGRLRDDVAKLTDRRTGYPRFGTWPSSALTTYDTGAKTHPR